MIAALASDLRSGIRALRKYPVLSIGAVVTFGLGLGVSTTVFAIANGAMFKALPFDEPDRVVALFETKTQAPNDYLAVPVQDLQVWQERQTLFDEIGAYDQDSINLSDDAGRPEHVAAGMMTVGAFQTLKVKPVLGRGFESGDDVVGAADVVLLGDDVWRNRFGAAPDILGKMIRVNGVARRVIGVMPPRFGFPERQAMWLPLRYDASATPRGKGPNYAVVGRLKHGVSIAAAHAELSTLAAGISREFPTTNADVGADLLPYARSELGQEAYALLYTMLGAGIGVLLIACVNVSNLLVARASLRRREVAVRMALGASRARVVGQHLTEVLLLALAGGAIGVAGSVLGVRWFNDALSADPPPFWMTFGVDWHVVLFLGAIILLAALIAGATPAWHAARVSAGTVLKDDSRSSTSARFGRLSGALVIAELAISCGLLIAAGLMVKSVAQLRTSKLPFTIENVVTMSVDLPEGRYRDGVARERFCEVLLPKLQAQPGVDAASLSDNLPAARTSRNSIQIEGRSYAKDGDYPPARHATVTPSYFQTFQIAPVRGRMFDASDDERGLRVALVNQSFVRELLSGVEPIGHRIRRGRDDATAPWLTIVGIVPDMQMQGLGNTDSGAGYYVPIVQTTIGGTVEIALRGRQAGSVILAKVREAVASLDRDLPLYDVMTMTQIVQTQSMFYNIFGVFFVTFGAIALFLAAAGLYGVMSFAVTQRTREMGVRSALGAPGRRLVLLIMRRSLVQLAIGLLLGLGLWLAAASPLEPVLYHVSPHDPYVAALIVAVLGVVAIAASLLPAWRVTKVDPVIALSAE
jgi:putative ABC transport system permease protein